MHSMPADPPLDPLLSRRRFLTAQAAVAGTLALPAWAAAASEGARERERFFAAVAAGRLHEVAALLDADAGLAQARDAEGRTGFTLAHVHGHAAVGVLLEERGYRPDVHELALATDWQRFEPAARAAPGALVQDHPVGGSAMYAAAVGGAGTQIWRVYQFGVDPDVRPGDGADRSPLRAALDHHDLATAEMTAFTLLSNGADPTLPEPGGDSPLHAAARRGSWDLVEMLVRLGAGVDAANDAGARPLDLAEEGGHGSVAKLLREHRRIPRSHSTSRRAYDIEGNPYRPPSLGAYATLAVQDTVGMAHFRFDDLRRVAEADPKLVHSVAATTEGAVEACAHTGRLEIVDYLLELGAPYSLPTAAMRGDAATLRRLLAEDPLRIHERGAHDFALLWYPVIGDHIYIAEQLLAAGAEVEQQHQLGTTALHWAARMGRAELIELFVQHGADPHRLGRKFGGAPKTPLDLAREGEHHDAVRLLQDRATG